jgi:chemotaxis protein MotB
MGKKPRKHVCEEMPPWMITFSDVMTLMLTFFVLLVSMSKIDERRKLVVLGSIIGAFGWESSYDVMSTKDTKRTVEPGVIEDEEDLAMLKPMLWEDIEHDLDFQSNRFVQVLSVNAELLFPPGSTTLSPQGQAFLEQIAPTLQRVQYPLLLAGHASSVRDELGAEYKYGDADQTPDLSWKISLDRCLAVYSALTALGVPPEKLSIEAYGRFRPHYSETDPALRHKNSRVDIVLDKRNTLVQAAEVDEAAETVREPEPETYDVNGFRFELDRPR